MGDDWDASERTVETKSKANDGDWGSDVKQSTSSYGGGDSGRGGFSGRGRGGSSGDRGDRTQRDGGERKQFEPREGDWTCPGCSNSNYARRTECQKCQTPKDDSAGGGETKEKKPYEPREGDWSCADCNTSNYKWRKECMKCNVQRPSTGEDNGEKTDEKPREIYVPPEPSNDEAEMFGAGISAGINFDKFDNIEVKASGMGNIKKIESFEAAELRPFLLANVTKSGYLKPTPVQKFAIPIIMGKRDMMACAQTGSGKTAAFMLPILNSIMNDNDDASNGRPLCLIVAPTRELVIQIFEEARKFANASWVKVAIAYGGTASRHQSDNIAKGCHILVATPGRLMDFVDKSVITFESLKFLVLDEADRMLDMGFLDTITKVANHETLKKENVQTLMFSATFPEEIQRLAATFLRDYIFLTVGIVGGASTDVEQEVIEVGKFKKRNKLGEILKEYMDNKDEDRILVFVETKKNADFLASFMSETKMSSTSIHGDRLQREREEALRDFRTGKRKVLIATSVAARGLDIKGVTHVINYDLPKDVQDYVHRIGRTGRVGNRGKATSFFDPEHDMAIAGSLARILKDAGQPIPEFLGDVSSSGVEGDFGGQDIRRGVDAGKPQEQEELW